MAIEERRRVGIRLTVLQSVITVIFSMLAVSSALVYSFGQIVGNRRQGWAILSAIAILLIAKRDPAVEIRVKMDCGSEPQAVRTGQGVVTQDDRVTVEADHLDGQSDGLRNWL